MKVCPNCGNEIKDDSSFCSKCGKNLDDDSKIEKELDNEITEGFFKKITSGRKKYILIGLIALISIFAIFAFFLVSSANGATFDNGEISFNYYDDKYSIQPPSSDDDPSTVVIGMDETTTSMFTVYKDEINGDSMDYAALYESVAADSSYDNVTNFKTINIADTTGYQWEYQYEGMKFEVVYFEKNGIQYQLSYLYNPNSEQAYSNPEDEYQLKKDLFETYVVDTFQVK